jgi:hypothetical protein
MPNVFSLACMAGEGVRVVDWSPHLVHVPRHKPPILLYSVVDSGMFGFDGVRG